MEKYILLLLVLIGISNTEYSLPSPFLPDELKEKGVESWTGLIFSVYALASVITSLYLGKLLNWVPHRKIITAGSTLLSLSIVGFGAVHYVDDKILIVSLFILTRIGQGMAIAMINTSAYAYASLANPEKVEKTISLFEALTGIGNAVGPILGSLLYDLMGFTGVFYTIGIF